MNLDKELTSRGHKFVRYADDCSIYVKSERSAKRVVENITRYIEEELLLKVNREKTKVSRPSESYLLGFSFYKKEGKHQIRIHPKPIERVKAKCRKITRSSDPTCEKTKLAKLAEVIRGWVNYFKLAKARSIMQQLDEMIRTRLRISTWRRWKRVRTRVTNLKRLGMPKQVAFMWGNGSKGACRIAHSPILLQTLNKKYFVKLGYVGFYNYYVQWQNEPTLTF